jgi:hypothetical protein
MKRRSVVLASVGAFVAISAVFAGWANAHIRHSETITYGQDSLPRGVFAYCEQGNGCSDVNDYAYYGVQQNNDWNQILMSAWATNLHGSDKAFCSLVVECSDGNYLTDNQLWSATCSVTCPWGTHAQTIYAEAGVQP